MTLKTSKVHVFYEGHTNLTAPHFVFMLVNVEANQGYLSNICEKEFYDEIVITGDMNSDPHKGRFFKEFVKSKI